MYTKNSEAGDLASVSKLRDIEAQRHAIVSSLHRYADTVQALAKLFGAANLHLRDVERATSWYGADAEVDLDAIMKTVDARFWDLAISSTGLHQILSTELENKLRKQYQENPPPFSADAAETIINRLLDGRGALVLIAVRSVFQKLVASTFRRGNDWHHAKERRSHDMVRKSFRFSHFYAGFSGYTSYGDDRFELFNDMEHVCNLINARPKVTHPNRLGDLMRSDFMRGSVFPREYAACDFTLTVFKCGNVKIDFTNDQTLAMLNRQGSDGRTLADPFGDQPATGG